MALFIANVGVNAAHRVHSPLFDDGTFRLLPIFEAGAWTPPMLRLGDLPELAAQAPDRYLEMPVHFDPELISRTPTYGDNCRRAARAFSLRRARVGDLILFLARLVPGTRAPGFFLVGELHVAEILPDVIADPGPGWWDGNAHVRRARATGRWDSFWVFLGGPGTGLYPTARRFGRREAEAMFPEPWNWRPNRTELQTIGSYTRTVRRLAPAAG